MQGTPAWHGNVYPAMWATPQWPPQVSDTQFGAAPGSLSELKSMGNTWAVPQGPSFLPEEDDYDPRKVKYMTLAAEEDIQQQQAALSQRQAAKLESIVAKRKGQHNEVVQHYEKILDELRGQAKVNSDAIARSESAEELRRGSNLLPSRPSFSHRRGPSNAENVEPGHGDAPGAEWAPCASKAALAPPPPPARLGRAGAAEEARGAGAAAEIAREFALMHSRDDRDTRAVAALGSQLLLVALGWGGAGAGGPGAPRAP